MTLAEMRRYYQTTERVERYAPGDRARERELASLYRSHRRFFGQRVLDLACGGGVLGAVLGRGDHQYVGVDINPEMLARAREAATRRTSTDRFLDGDVSRRAVPGTFDTLTLLGNALSHLTVEEFARLLRRRRRNVHRGSYLIVDYRDTVGMFYRGEWRTPYVETHKGERTFHRTQAVDLERGVIRIRARRPGAWTVEFTQKIWSPFLLDAIAHEHGWTRVSRRGVPNRQAWIDVYRFSGS